MRPVTIACDLIVDRLVRLGVTHVFGVGGANIEDMFAAVQRRRPAIQVVLAKHEHSGGTAAEAYARIRGDLGVVMTTSGGGAMNLVHAIAEARAAGTPLLAIVGEPPRELQGRGAFQDTSGRSGAVDAAAVFGAAARWCARVERAEDLPRLVDEAIAAARGECPGPAVLLVAKDLQAATIAGPTDAIAPPPSAPIAAAQVRAATTVLDARPIVVLAGPEVAQSGAVDRLARLVDALDARVAVAPDARDAFDNDDPRFLGVAGAMGHPAVAGAMAEARACVAVGTRIDWLTRLGLEPLLRDRPLLAIGRASPLGDATAHAIRLAGGTAACLDALLEAIGATPGRPRVAPSTVPAITTTTGFGAADALGVVDRLTPAGAVILVDAGNTGAAAVHHVRAPRGGRWLLAMGMAGMGYTFGGAIGAAFASGQRCVVLAGDGAFYMHGLELHTAVEHRLPITYVILDNRAHGMCLVRERLLLGDNAGYNAFGRVRLGAGLAAMFPRLAAVDCRDRGEFEVEFARSLDRTGPTVVCAQLDRVEIPPFAAFARAVEQGVTSVPRGGDDAQD